MRNSLIFNGYAFFSIFQHFPIYKSGFLVYNGPVRKPTTMEKINYAKLAGSLSGGIQALKYDIELFKAMNYDEKIFSLFKSKIDQVIKNATENSTEQQ